MTKSLNAYLDDIGQFTDEDVKSWQTATAGWTSVGGSERADRHWIANRLLIGTGHVHWKNVYWIALQHLEDLADDIRYSGNARTLGPVLLPEGLEDETQ